MKLVIGWLALALAAPRVGAAPANNPAPWSEAGEFVAMIGDTLYEWNRDGDGAIAERSAIDGSPRRRRPIARLHINGAPQSWEAIPGGYLAAWDAPTVIREAKDGSLSVGWVAKGGDWWNGTQVVVGSSVIAAQSRDASAIVRLSLADGHVEWRTVLSKWSQGLELEVDDKYVYVTHTEYSQTVPTPTITIPRRVIAFALATGRQAWHVDFTSEPEGMATSNGTIAAVFDHELRFIDGATGNVIARVPTEHGESNNRMRIADGTVYVTSNAGAKAFELATGNLRWHTALALDGGGSPVVFGDTLFVAGVGATIAAIDTSTGRLRWSIGVGIGGFGLWASATAVVLHTSNSAAGFGLQPSAPIERATFYGRVVAVECGNVDDAQVSVGATTVHVDQHGNFNVAIEARGIVVVEGPGEFILRRGDAPLNKVASVSIPLTGQHVYHVRDLTFSDCSAE